MADMTTLQLNTVQASNVSVITSTTVLTQSGGTINLGSLSLSNTNPVDVARTPSAGTSNVAARSDHAHSAATLLLDGGNY
jgi:hypothetical protein